MSAPVGRCCVVLHTHLPWLPHHGTWPVGEEWLYQAWAASYLPLVDLLESLAADGRRDLLTLGVTPIVAAQLDDPYCLEQFHVWLGDWQLRAEGLAGRPERHLRDLAGYEFRLAAAALERFETRWRHGGSPVLRALADSGVVELLGGPATHPFQPLLDDRLVASALDLGLHDGALRFGSRPDGIWAPECGYRPGLERHYAAAGVRRFLVDGPNLVAGRPHDHRAHDNLATADAWTVGDTDVVVFGRDLDVTYRVWSPRRGYPGGKWYRDFHTWDHPSGLHPARVTSTRSAPEQKAPYEPAAAAAAALADARDFVDVVRRRLALLAEARGGRPGTVVAAYDTELFGHWWHEGPAFLGHVLRLLPKAGVEVTTLARAAESGAVAGPVDLPAGSWGSAKDWRVWNGPQVQELVEGNAQLQARLLGVLDKALDAPGARGARRADLDQLAREALLALSSDWAFMVTKQSAPDYARFRARTHTERFDRLATLIESGRHQDALRLATDLRAVDRPFGHLDARQI